MNHMVSRSFRGFRRRYFASFFKPTFNSCSPCPRPILYQERTLASFNSSNSWWAFRNLTICRRYGSSSSSSSVRCVISQGKPKFEIFEIDPPKKYKWLTKKRLKLQRKKEKQKRRSANKRDPRRLTIKGSKRKGKFATVEERIKYKLEKTKIKEALLIERLKSYEVPKLQGPMVKPVEITGEERFYMKKMAQKGSNYVPVGRRGVFGGVVLNMHMHWKKHETVKVICKPCKPDQVHEYANEIARLSGGIPIQVIGDDTIVFYRGKDYVQPEVMSPIDTLSKKKALEKSKYEQSLESARHFIAIAEKELELYRRHIALYGDPADHNPKTVVGGVSESTGKRKQDNFDSSSNEELSANDDDYEHDDLSLSDTNCTDELSTELDSSDEET
ncbi:uncharacterized CRM domain-containing protein At3g25440, chloroplastic [Cynara cardunculus var. scolymus]|uniref:uncharacterized CRM domain-containing protein At3g25440, chloroplastic n=1 Tax=Cynara cardunculus var. scolymus TaxID=59895 RepID=UPI000D6257AE|nr:uncharacterized CRM domain-containing protein At3g25440, chloroplastic [Cynara cardunculus var. scolymus]